MAGKVFWGVNSLISAESPPGDPTLILLGDSWFWYPFNNLANELAARLSPRHVLLVIGNNGAEAQEWSSKYRKQIDLAFKWYAEHAEGLLLSGGGNDVAGTEDFDPIIEDNCTGAPSADACYSPGQPMGVLHKVQASYREVIAKFRRYNPSAPVFSHNYEKAWPTGKGLFGPADWLKAPMDKAKVPAKLRHPLFVDLLEQLHQVQVDLAGSVPGPGKFIPIKTTGTLPDKDDIWANELHLKPSGFKQMVELAWLAPLRNENIV